MSVGVLSATLVGFYWGERSTRSKLKEEGHSLNYDDDDDAATHYDKLAW